MASAFPNWHKLKPQVTLSEHSLAEHLESETLQHHSQDIRQANISSSLVSLKTLDSTLQWFSNR